MESDLAIAAFESAVQDAKETPILWGARAKELYTRAYPLQNVNDRVCINRFVVGLKDKEVAMYVHEQRPQTFEEANTQAQAKTASKQFLQSQWQGRGADHGGRGAHISNIDGKKGNNAGNRTFGCWFCGDPAHMRKDCPDYKKTSKELRDKRKAAQGQKGGGGGANKTPAVNQIGQETGN